MTLSVTPETYQNLLELHCLQTMPFLKKELEVITLKKNMLKRRENELYTLPHVNENCKPQNRYRVHNFLLTPYQFAVLYSNKCPLP